MIDGWAVGDYVPGMREWQDEQKSWPAKLNAVTTLNHKLCWYITDYNKASGYNVCILDRGHDEGKHELSPSEEPPVTLSALNEMIRSADGGYADNVLDYEVFVEVTPSGGGFIPFQYHVDYVKVTQEDRTVTIGVIVDV